MSFQAANMLNSNSASVVLSMFIFLVSVAERLYLQYY